MSESFLLLFGQYSKFGEETKMAKSHDPQQKCVTPINMGGSADVKTEQLISTPNKNEIPGQFISTRNKR